MISWLPASSRFSLSTAAWGTTTCVSVPGSTMLHTVTFPASVGRMISMLCRLGTGPGAMVQEMVPVKLVSGC